MGVHKENIINELSDYGPKKVDAFINRILPLLKGMRNLYSQKTNDPDRKKIKSHRNKLNSILEKEIKVLKECYHIFFEKLQFNPLRNFKIEHLKRDPYDFYLSYFESLVITEKAIESLIKILDNTLKKNWKLSKAVHSPSTFSGVIDMLIQNWIEFFKEVPMANKGRPFFQIVCICLEYANMPCGDPEKAIREVLKKIFHLSILILTFEGIIYKL